MGEQSPIISPVDTTSALNNLNLDSDTTTVRDNGGTDKVEQILMEGWRKEIEESEEKVKRVRNNETRRGLACEGASCEEIAHIHSPHTHASYDIRRAFRRHKLCAL